MAGWLKQLITGDTTRPTSAMRAASTGALRQFYEAGTPAASTPSEQLRLLAVDVETGGLDPHKHPLLSIGWVPINGREIDLSGAGYYVLNDGNDAAGVGESATIHGLTDDAVAAGADPQQALTALLKALSGRVMLAHFKNIEQGFLSHACRRYFGAALHVPIVDTFALERRHMEKMGTYPRGEDLRLARIRGRYDLPYYPSHNALTDALACAELYLALDVSTGAILKQLLNP
ncbi:hypothetical protein CARG_04100 [Corynebacterium argentoratense DSM 44202]|uniref:Exonuclease domain-containing protein n=2 Tax=Corynebacterium argentoratense TaxID=42817 RepID=U3GZ46_9CORY|nr:hypothetical protein CARG_04100 [Corynebacterium argentoratense DSM 44202]